MDKRTQGPRHLPPCLPNDCTANNIEWEELKQAESDHATSPASGQGCKKIKAARRKDASRNIDVTSIR